MIQNVVGVERIRTSDPIVPNDVRYQAALHSDIATDLGRRTGLIGAVFTRRKRRARAPHRAPWQKRGRPSCSLDPSRAKLQTFESGRIPAARGASVGRRRAATGLRGSRMSFRLKPLALAVALIASAGVAAADDLKVALIYGLTGPLQAYAKQTETGLKLGFEYATKGSMEVDGRKIVIITKTTRASPTSPERAGEAYEDEGADSPSARPPRPRRCRHAAGRRGTQKFLSSSPAVAAPDHRRQSGNPLHFWNGAQSAAGPIRTFGDRWARRAYCDAGAGSCVRSRRGRSVQKARAK